LEAKKEKKNHREAPMENSGSIRCPQIRKKGKRVSRGKGSWGGGQREYKTKDRTRGDAKMVEKGYY